MWKLVSSGLSVVYLCSGSAVMSPVTDLKFKEGRHAWILRRTSSLLGHLLQVRTLQVMQAKRDFFVLARDRAVRVQGHLGI